MEGWWRSVGGWLVVGSLGGEKVAWGRRTEDSFGGRRTGDIGTGWDSGVGMEIDMTVGMGLSRCRGLGASAVHMYWSMSMYGASMNADSPPPIDLSRAAWSPRVQ